MIKIMNNVSLKFWFSLIFLGFLSSFAHAENTKWYAGSSHTGDVIIQIEDMDNDSAVVWHCNGQRCQLDGPWGNDLSLISCRNLVKKVGKVTYYGNNKGKLWSPVSGRKMLDRCNRGYDLDKYH